MKAIAIFCNNTGQKTQNDNDEIEVILKQQLKKGDFEEIRKWNCSQKPLAVKQI